MSRIVPDNWLPAAGAQRIIVHWTAGSHHASAIDREHYHFLIEGDGHLVQGDHTIADNVHTDDDNYAAHTRGLNTDSIGIACCAMQGAIQSPFQPGSARLNAEQYEALVQACADLAQHYHLEVTERTVLSHGEVERVYGKLQRGKWDITVLPWAVDWSPLQVGTAFRRRVQEAMRASQPQVGLPVNVELNGHLIANDGLIRQYEAQALVPLRPIANSLGWFITGLVQYHVRILRQTAPALNIPFIQRGDRAFVYAGDLAKACGWKQPEWVEPTRTVVLESHS